MDHVFFCRNTGEIFEVPEATSLPHCPICHDCLPSTLPLNVGEKQSCSVNGQVIEIIKIPYEDSHLTYYYMVFQRNNTWRAARLVVHTINNHREVIGDHLWWCGNDRGRDTSLGVSCGCFWFFGICVYIVLTEEFSKEITHGRDQGSCGDQQDHQGDCGVSEGERAGVDSEHLY